MSKTAITTPTMVINNIAVAYIPNSLSYKDGLGEQTVKTQSAGGGQVETVYFDDAESKMGSVKFQIFPTGEGIEAAKDWKTLLNTNAIILTSPNGFTRAFQNMAMINDPDNNLSSDGSIDIEFMGDPAI
jgi:hypothetical protein